MPKVIEIMNIETSDTPAHSLLDTDKLTIPPQALEQDVSEISDGEPQTNDDDDTASESEGEYVIYDEDIPLDDERDKLDEENDDREFVQFTLLDDSEYRKFEDDMNKAMRSGPYLKAGRCGVVRSFPDLYHLVKRPQNTQVFISSIVASERFSDSSFRSKLLAQDDERENFHYGLRPHMEDYLEDRIVEVPGLGGDHQTFQRSPDYQDWNNNETSGGRSPLSYQKAVWDMEDQEGDSGVDSQPTIYDLEVDNYKSAFPPSSHTESLICEKGEDDLISEHEMRSVREPFPSSIRKTTFEKGLLNPQLRHGSELTTDENRLLRMKKTSPEEIPSKPGWSFIPKFISNIKEKYAEAVRDEEEIGLLKQNLTFGCFIQTILLFFFSIAIVIGLFIQIGTGYLFPLFLSLQWLFMSTYNKWKTDLSHYYCKRNERRKRLGTRFGKISIDRHPISPMFSGLGPTPTVKNNVSPLDGLKLKKPDGPAGWSPGAPRIFHIEKARISEAKVEVTDQRPHLLITLPDNTVKSALFDTGSTSCGIHPRVLAELEKTVSIPKERKTFDLKGVIPGASAEIKEIAYITIRLETGYEIKHVPFLVVESNFELLIGANLVRSQRWCNYWKNDTYYVDLGKDHEPVKAVFKSTDSVSAVSIGCVEVLPGESKVIALEIPELKGLKGTIFHKNDLFVEPILNNGTGLEVLPGYTRLNKNMITAQVVNKHSCPLVFEQPLELAKIDVVPRNDKTTDLTEIRQIKALFDNIPRVDPDSLLEVKKEGKQTFGNNHPLQVHIQFTDRFGMTPTNDNLITCSSADGVVQPLKPLEPGILIKKHFSGKIKRLTSEQKKKAVYSIFLIPDENGDYSFISDAEISKIKKEMKMSFQGNGLPSPCYFMLDPLTTMSIGSMDLTNRIWKQLHFNFMPCVFDPDYPENLQFSKQNFPPEILAGTMVTKLHIQSGSTLPPPELTKKDKGSPVFRTSVMGAALTIFKLGILLICHVHLPAGAMGQSLNEHVKDRMFYVVFNELRLLRVPTDFHITIDDLPFSKDTDPPDKLYMSKLGETAFKIPYFYPPNQRCNMMTQNFEEEQVDLCHQYCPCLLCLEKFNPFTSPNDGKHGMVELFRGDINTLVGQGRPAPGRFPPKAPDKSKKKRDRAIIASFTAEEEIDFDHPLDPLGLTDDIEISKFLGTTPESEYDDPPADRPQPVRSDPAILKDPPIGIPDSFTPGDWREHFDISKIDIPEAIREKLADLFDEFKNLLSCYSTDCRPILVDGEPAVVDIELTTDKPIFIKPYPMASRMAEVLDKKIEEMLGRNEIVEVTSRFNVPLLLTHHNSANKNVDFDDKSWRVVCDLRAVNASIVCKNEYSHLVKGIEHLYPRLRFMKYFSIFDCRRAYRSLVASENLRRICAFRTPSSLIHPYKTWAYRSTPDGLAILPGLYSYFVQKSLSEKSRKCTIQHIDDILIFSPDMATHIEDIRSVFTDLLKSNFLLSVSKIKAFQTEVTFLGHVVNGENIWIPDERKSYFDSLKVPKTKKELQSLLGVAGFMSSHVDSFQLRSGLLFEALKGKTDKQALNLTPEQIRSFEDLKLAIKNAEKLHIVDFDKPIFMEADACFYGIGSVLYQEVDDPDNPLKPKRHIIRYGSRRFSVTEALHHTSLEKEAMSILASVKSHMYYLVNCPEAIIKTDLKSLITLLSCYSSPESARMARLSHKLYSLPFKWSLQHIAGVDLPIADALSRLHPPYNCAFSNRHQRYPDLKRDAIFIPPEWRKTPNVVLTTSDILTAMHEQIVFFEKSSPNVKTKRLKALMSEIVTIYDTLEGKSDDLIDKIQTELKEIEETAKILEKHSDKTKKPDVTFNALTAVSPRVMITPQFLVKHQSENPKFHGIITQLRTIPRDKIKAKILKKYRLLNDSILVSRKDKRLPFDSPGNIRIMCDTKMTLIILSLLHVMSGHNGVNTLCRTFSLTYKSTNAVQSYSKIVCYGCRACRLHRPVNRRTVRPSRIPIPANCYHTWSVDHMCFAKDQYWKGKKIDAAFNIIDNYSNLLWSFLVPDQKHTTTIKCFKELFSTTPAPLKIISDNGPALCANKDVVAFLKSKGVQAIATITPHNSKANKTERIHKTLRETLALVKETFQRRSQFDMYHTVVEMLNNRPLSLVLYPHIKEMLKGKTEIVTPFSLHYGFKPPLHPMVTMEDKLLPDDREGYQKRWRNILSEHDKILQAELDENNKDFKENEEIQKGDLVLLVNVVGHKEKLKYYRNLYEVISIQKAKYYCTPLFGGASLVGVSGNNLKPYRYNELFELLPPDIRHLMGESLPPDELKKRRTTNPADVPSDFRDWGLLKIPEAMKLRNRLTPASLLSVPAISLSNTNTVSHISSDDPDSDSGLTLDNESLLAPHTQSSSIISLDMPEYKIEKIKNPLSTLSVDPQQGSLLSNNPEGVPQLKSTDTGLEEVQTRAIRILPPKAKLIPYPVRKRTPQVSPIKPGKVVDWSRLLERIQELKKAKKLERDERSRQPKKPASLPDVSTIQRPTRIVQTSPLPSPMEETFDEMKQNRTIYFSPESSPELSGIGTISPPGSPFLTPVLTPGPSPVKLSPLPDSPKSPVQQPIIPAPRPTLPELTTPRMPLQTRAGRLIRVPKRLLGYLTDLVADDKGVVLQPQNLEHEPLKAEVKPKPASEDVKHPTKSEPEKPPPAAEVRPSRPLSPEVLVVNRDQPKEPAKPKSILKAGGQKPDKSKKITLIHDGRGESNSPEQTIFTDKSDLYTTAQQSQLSETIFETPTPEKLSPAKNQRILLQQPITNLPDPQGITPTISGWRKTETEQATPTTPETSRITSDQLKDYFNKLLTRKVSPEELRRSSRLRDLASKTATAPEKADIIKQPTFKPVSSTPIASSSERPDLDKTEPMDYSFILPPSKQLKWDPPSYLQGEPMDYSTIKTPVGHRTPEAQGWRHGNPIIDEDAKDPTQKSFDQSWAKVTPVIQQPTGPVKHGFVLKPAVFPSRKPATPLQFATATPPPVGFYIPVTPTKTPKKSPKSRDGSSFIPFDEADLTSPILATGPPRRSSFYTPPKTSPVKTPSATPIKTPPTPSPVRTPPTAMSPDEPSSAQKPDSGETTPKWEQTYAELDKLTSASNLKPIRSKTPPLQPSTQSPPPIRRGYSEGNQPAARDFAKELRDLLEIERQKQARASPPRTESVPPSPVKSPRHDEQEPPHPGADQQQHQEQQQQQQDEPQAHGGAIPKVRKPRGKKSQQSDQEEQQPQPEPRRGSRQRTEPKRYGWD